MDVPIRERGVYCFGPFRLDPVRRCLLRGSARISLTARLFDTLLYLVENHERLVARDELERAVWRGRRVEEGNLGRAVSSLRKALQGADGGEVLIVTAPGRGYRFAVPVSFEPEAYRPIASGLIGPAGGIDSAGLADAATQATPGWRRGSAIALLLAVGAAGGALLLRAPPAPTPAPFSAPRMSVVVMPFRNPGGDRHAADLAVRMANDLTRDLHRIPAGIVKGPESAIGLGGKPVGEIGRSLDVRYVFQATLLSAEGRLEVPVTLSEAQTGTQLWARIYNPHADGPQQSPADIVHDIASMLDAKLLDAEVARAARERPPHPDALGLFLQGRAAVNRADDLAPMEQAQHLFEQAIAAEPRFLEALSALGWMLSRKIQGYSDPDYAADTELARQVIDRALAIDKTDPTALAARGRWLAIKGRCAEASAVFETVLGADPENAEALSGRALCAWANGEPDKALADLSAILQIDPHAPDLNHIYRRAGIAALFAGRYGQAKDLLLRGEARQADQPADLDKLSPMESGRVYLIAAYALDGDLPEARRRAQAFQAIWPHRSAWRETAYLNSRQAKLPSVAKVEQALRESGLPLFSNEYEDDHVAPTAAPLNGLDFTATPLSVPGAQTIDTATLVRMRAAEPPPVVVQVGKFRAVLPDAIKLDDDEAAYTRAQMDASGFADRLRQGARGGIVVMGTGVAGVQGYNAALHFTALGYGRVYWYRGGEEAWAAHGLPAADERIP